MNRDKLTGIILAAGCSLLISQNLMAQDFLASTDIEDDPFLLYGDEELISIATGTFKPLHLAPSVATVITAKDIEAMGARNLDEVLEVVPGLHVGKTDTRLEANYIIRGIKTKLTPQVQILINGVNMDNQVNGALIPLFRLNVANISRIEIIRGPGSAVYGADAFSGVINIITKDADELDGTVVGARLGSFSSKDVWVQHGGNIKGWSTAFSFEYSKSEGDKSRVIDADTQTLFDSLYNQASTSPLGISHLPDIPNASLAPVALNTQFNQMNTSLTFLKNEWKVWLNSWRLWDGGQGAGAAQAIDTVGRQTAELYTLMLKYHDDDLTDLLALDTQFSYTYMDQQATFQLLPPGARVLLATDGNLQGAKNPNPNAGFVIFSDGYLGNPGGEGDTVFFESALTFKDIKSHTIRLAVGFMAVDIKGKATQNFGPGVIDTSVLSMLSDTVIDGSLTDVTGTPSNFMNRQTRQVRYVSAQDEWRFLSDWELTAGIRYDEFSDFGSTTNPRLALVWAMDYNLTSKLLYGRAFRAPALNELYFRNNPSVLGNPNVQPETIDMLELVFDYRPNFNTETVFNFFRYQIKDLIDFSTGVAENENDQDGYGFEADVKWNASNDVVVLANFVVQQSEDSNTGEPVANAPSRQASLGIRFKMNQMCSLMPQINWVADRRRAYGDTRSQIDDYTMVDVALRCHNVANYPLGVTAGIRNFTDTDAREPGPATVINDYPLESRAVYIEASYHFDSK